MPVAERVAFPDVEVRVNGLSRRLSSFSGPIVVDVWASWCGRCRQGLPELDRAAHAHPGVPFVAISVDKLETDALAALAGQAPAFVPAWAGEAALQSLAGGSIPATFVLDADHRVVARLRGYSPGRMEQFVRVLGELQGG